MATSYTLVNKQRSGDVLITRVNFNFDGVLVNNVDIPHFRPVSKQEVQNNIRKYGIQEKERLDAANLIDIFINNLDTTG